MIFVFSLDDELSFSVLSGYYAKMAQYRKYISDIPVVLVAITGENDDHIISVYFSSFSRGEQVSLLQIVLEARFDFRRFLVSSPFFSPRRDFRERARAQFSNSGC